MQFTHHGKDLYIGRYGIYFMSYLISLTPLYTMLNAQMGTQYDGYHLMINN